MIPPTLHRRARWQRALRASLAALIALTAGLGWDQARTGTEPLLPTDAALAAAVRGAAPYLQESCPEPNDGFPQACPISPPARLTGFIQTPDDLDTFVVRVAAPGRLLATLSGLPADYDLHVYNASAQLVVESQREGNADEAIDTQIGAPGNYFIFVNAGRGDSDPTAPYQLVVDLLGAGAIQGTQPAGAVELPPPPAEPTPTQAAVSEPPAVLESISGGRAVVRRSDGSAQDGAPPGTELEPGDQLAVVGDGNAALRLLGGSVATLNKNSALALSRLERNSDGVITIVLEQTRGSGVHSVGGLSNPAATYTVVANRVSTVARGTGFGVTLRDDGWVLIDCLECDPNKVTAADQPIGSGQRLAVSPASERIWLKLYEDPPNPEPTRDEEEERRQQGKNQG
jgi:hypothetical protein